MSILSRDELIALIRSKELKLDDSEGYINTWVDKPYSYDNPFQQCSIDLHVGYIYVPETDPEKPGGSLKPKTDEHMLGIGHTIMIRTKEEITLPNDLGAICFSPSRLALKAILITNTGHVDPGYSGHLHFTAINMGNEPFSFRSKDIICTMVFFRLSEKVSPYGKESFVNIPGGNSIPAVIDNSFPKLSKDFIDVEKRAELIAKAEIDKSKFLQFGIPFLTALVIAAFSLLQVFISKPWEKELSQLVYRVESVEKKVNVEGRIKTLEEKILELQANKAGRDMGVQDNGESMDYAK